MNNATSFDDFFVLYSSVNYYSVNYQISTGTCFTYHETSVVGKVADWDFDPAGEL